MGWPAHERRVASRRAHRGGVQAWMAKGGLRLLPRFLGLPCSEPASRRDLDVAVASVMSSLAAHGPSLSPPKIALHTLF